MVVDERAEDEFAPGGSDIERLLAASSVLHCLPVGRSQPGSAATGALLRPADHAGVRRAGGVRDGRTWRRSSTTSSGSSC